jgi:hypothetical protein
MERPMHKLSILRRLSRPLLAVLAAGLIASAFAATPAAADEWGRGRGDGWRGQEGREHAWRAERAREWREAVWRERAREWRAEQWRARQAYAYPNYYGYGTYAPAPSYVPVPQAEW